MVIIDVEYYLSQFITRNQEISLNFMPEVPVNIPLDNFGNWAPLSTSIINFMFNYPNYNEVTLTYTFHQFMSTQEVADYFRGNYFLIERICTIMNQTPVYVSSNADTANILNLSSQDLDVLFQILNNNSYDVNYVSNNRIVNSFLFLVSFTNNNNISNIPLINSENYDNLSQIIYYIAFYNKLKQIIKNQVTSLP
jgi:hypothetical protein